MEITREQVIEATTASKTITEIGRKLGLCGETLSGRDGRLLRSLLPGLDAMLAANRARARAASTESRKAGATPEAEAAADCPYRRGLYRTLFIESNRGFAALEELVSRLAAKGHPEKAVRFAWAVLRNPNHQSNSKRSTVIAEGPKVIALRRRPKVIWAG